MNNSGKQLSNASSTGGLGVHFENRVQASFAILMLTGGYPPCMPTWPICEIKLQGKYQGFDTDDLIVYLKHPGGNRKAKLLGQIKRSINLTKSSKEFGEAVKAAWTDFNNKDVFNEGTDVIALIAGPLSYADTDSVRMLLRQAEHSKDDEDFITRIQLTNFASDKQREKLEVFRAQLKAANDDNEVTNDQLWRFLKSFRLLIYDLDIKGVTLSLLHSLIGQYSPDRAEELLALIEQEVTYKSENAGFITPDTFPETIREAFLARAKTITPDELTTTPLEIIQLDWNQSEHASNLVFANLIGSWNENNTSDIDIAVQLTGEPFPEWISKIRETLQNPDSPVKLKNGVWSVLRREELWHTLGRRIFDNNLEKLKQCAVEVLTERDPLLALPQDERFTASFYGKSMKYSKTIRKGICETLALLGLHAEVLTNCSRGKAEVIAALTVREITNSIDWQLWASLNDLLPTIAEAAPDEFITAVENALDNSPCPFDELFAQEDSGFGGRNYLTGLLWALETLAWEEHFLVRVTVILGKLASRDPGGNWANRPLKTLETVFLPWLPQTTASVLKRKVAVLTLLRESPEIGWELLLKLLPNQRQTSSGSHRPNWRKTIPDEWTKKPTREEYWEQVENYCNIAVDTAKSDLTKLTELVRHLDHLPPVSFEQVITHLSSDIILGKSESERNELWTELTMFVLRHKRYSYTKWALKPELVAKIEQVTKELTPTNPMNIHRILFSTKRESDLYDAVGNWDQQRKQLEERRQNAVKDIFEYGGIDAIIQFAKAVESPYYVGESLGVYIQSEVESSVIPDLLILDDKKLTQFACTFVWGRYRNQGWVWADKIRMIGWTHAQIGRFYACLPFSEDTWKRVNLVLGVAEEKYWRIVNVNPYQNDSELETAIDKLLEFDRPNSAIECLYNLLHQKQPLDKNRTVKALLAAISTSESSDTMNTHYISEIIEAIQADPDTNPDDLFRIEWAYLPLLAWDDGSSAKLLEDRLASDPNFFCEVIRQVYRSKNEPKSDVEPSEQQQAIAENAYRLLDKWHKPPGLETDGTFQENEFVNWLDSIKALCGESGHLEVGLSHVGKVLYYVPADPDGLWINKTAAEALNTPDAESMRDGYRTEVYNSRGVHSVDPSGAPERELAEKYRCQAEEVENAGYYRFASALRELAESYDHDAERIMDELDHDDD